MGKKIIVTLFIVLFLSGVSVFAQGRLQDSLALVELFDSTDGHNWTDTTNWNNGPLDTWYGVIAPGDRVRGLELYGNNLSGTIPASIGDLDVLRDLYLYGNQLTGSIPPEIGNLTKLEYLYLYENQLTGSIPPEIGNLTKLEYLYLYENQLTDSIPPEIGSLTHLTDLFLYNNQLTGPIPPEIGGLTLLTRLYLYLNDLTGSIPPEIGNLTNLRVLDLRYNQLTGPIPPEIGNLKYLRYLQLSNNQLTGSFPEFDSLTDLGVLDLQDNDLVDLPPLSALSSLRDLSIQNNKFTFEDIEPNIGVPSSSFRYWPQDSVGEALDTTINQGSSLTISVSVGGEYNLYQWMKDGDTVLDAEDSAYTMDPVGLSDAGSYICEITNTVAIELTLYSRSINVTVVEPFITVITPNGGEDWQVGSNHDITWTSAGTSGNVSIEYSTNGSSWSNIIPSTPDDGTYSWTIPSTPSTSCLVRVLDTDGSPSDQSNAVFTISSIPFITVSSPNGGEDWKVDSTYDITWDSDGTSGAVKIEYSVNNGVDWSEIIASIPDTGVYSWSIPETPSDSCLVMVTDTNGSLTDASDAIFAISSVSAVPEPELPEDYSMSVTKRIIADNQLEVRYALPEKAKVKFSIYDLSGARVREMSEENPAGVYSLKINMSGKPAGIYFLKVEAEDFTETKKLTILK
jgi:Leucine-rich repeat (LRR) protein